MLYINGKKEIFLIIWEDINVLKKFLLLDIEFWSEFFNFLYMYLGVNLGIKMIECL